jgi:hypothetical protein
VSPQGLSSGIFGMSHIWFFSVIFLEICTAKYYSFELDKDAVQMNKRLQKESSRYAAIFAFFFGFN